MPQDVPVLHTVRLRMRPHTLRDFGHSAALWADPGITRYIGGKPSSAEEAWKRLLVYAGHWTLLGYGYWLVEEQHSGTFVGEVGFARYQRAIEPPLQDVPEIGWAIAPASQGKGYATEAVRAATRWGDAHLGATSTTCIIHPGNITSLNVAVKCGYRESPPAIYHGETTLVFIRDPS